MSTHPAFQTNTPIPERMKHVPTDHRGLPIPYIVQRDRQGKPMFIVNDAAKVAQCGAFGLCGICGKPLGRRPDSPSVGYFVGGPGCFYMKAGAFLDPPMHRECAEYALRVCPYIANPSYGRDQARLLSNHPERLAGSAPDGVDVLTAPASPGFEGKPPLFILGLCRRYDVLAQVMPGSSHPTTLFKPRSLNEWVYRVPWRDGQRLQWDDETKRAITEHIRRFGG